MDLNGSKNGGELPVDAEAFYRAGESFETLGEPDLSKYPSALERLGPSPFVKTGFPLVGFLATLYDHVVSMRKK